MTTNWDCRDFDSYRYGNDRQRAAWVALQPVVEDLRAFDPILAGTVPLDVDIEGSDLDLICCAPNLDAFAVAAARYGAEPSYSLWRGLVANEPTCVVRFDRGGFAVELFAQRVPADRQAAVRHLCSEKVLAERHGEPLRLAVRQLKRAGLSTEEAFCRVLGLEGDPYVVLLGVPEHTNLVENWHR